METKDILKYILLMIIFYLISNIFQPILSYKPVIDWWNQGSQGVNNANFFDIYALAYYEYFNIYYHIKTLFESEESKLSSIEVDVITTYIYSAGKGLVPGGYFTPKMLIDTCVPDDFPNPPVNRQGWKDRMATWGVTYDSSGYNVDNDKWVSGENFLYQNLQMPSDSPMVKGFVTNLAGDDNGKLYPTSLLPIFGIKNGRFGGILGAVRQGGDWGNNGVNEFLRAMWADDVHFKTESSKPPKSKCGSTSSVLGMASSGVAGGMGGLFLAEALGGPLALLVGVVGAGISAASTASQNGCF